MGAELFLIVPDWQSRPLPIAVQLISAEPFIDPRFRTINPLYFDQVTPTELQQTQYC